VSRKIKTPLLGGELKLNFRKYHIPAAKVAILCLDGFAHEYLDLALAKEKMPHLKRMIARGYYTSARAAMPTYTNVNNVSIITGVAPDAHGICGNYFYDAKKNKEVMMNSAEYMRYSNILAAVAGMNRKVAVVTAKEKLKDLLSAGLNGIAFSIEKGYRTYEWRLPSLYKLTGMKAASIYSAEASLQVVRAGTRLLEHDYADFVYLSLTDYIQHTYPPDHPAALDFCAKLDREIGGLVKTGAIIGATADHGMNAKHLADGKPNILYLEQMLTRRFGKGFRVILPITDPYVKHHGALGSFATVYVPATASVREIMAWALEQEGITEVYDRQTAAKKLELPDDRIGDVTVLSARNVVLGRSPRYHDLTQLEAPLRSHGGRYEEMVPFIVSKPMNKEYRQRGFMDLRNFDIFDFTLNGLWEWAD